MILTVHDELVLEVPLDEGRVEPLVRTSWIRLRAEGPTRGRPRLRPYLGRSQVAAVRRSLDLAGAVRGGLGAPRRARRRRA